MQTTSVSQVFSPQNVELHPNPSPIQTDVCAEDLCKFCFQSEQQSHEKLISPCGCSGSLKYVHKQCLQKWLLVEADKKQSPLAGISFKTRTPIFKCKLCSKQIIFEDEINLIGQVLSVFHWIRLFCVAKKLKYYACISILGSLAINYYFMKYFFGRLYKVGLKIKDHSWICLVVLSIVLVLLEHTFIEVKWNKNNMEFSIPYFNNK